MILTPKPATLKRYGLSEAEWRAILEKQGGVCAICKRVPSTGRTVIDHFHAKGWKKMPPEQRKLYVRGLCCWFCNHAFLGRGITVEKSRNVTLYLEEFEARKPKEK
jgi:hypothetical protein